MNRNVEQSAVNAILNALEPCPHLEPEIKTNDREILTDGHIAVYNPDADTRSTQSFDGKVKVQVKGRRVTNFNEAYSFAVKLKDLRGLVKEGGVLYFVVAINKLTGNKKIYYNILSVGRLNKLIDSTQPKQKHLNILFKAFPEDPNAIAGILKLANAQLNSKSIIPYGDLSPGQVVELQLTCRPEAADDFLTKQLHLDRASDDFLFYAETNDRRYLLDNDFIITPAEYFTSSPIDAISAGDFQADGCTWKRITPDIIEVQVTKGISFQAHAGDREKLSFNFTSAGNLIERYFDLNFMIDMNETGKLNISGKVFEIRRVKSTSTDVFRQQKESLRPFIELCELLEIDGTLIDPDEVTNPQAERLLEIRDALCSGKEVEDLRANYSIWFQEIGPWLIGLLVVSSETEGQSRFIGLTDGAISLARKPAPDASFPITPYELISRDILSRVLNLGPSVICQHYQKISESSCAKGLAFEMVCKLLHAAADKPDRADELLLLAGKLNDWNLTQNPRDIDLLINQWLIKSLRNTMHEDCLSEIRKTRRMLSDIPADEARYIACSILLKDFAEVEQTLKELPDATVEDLQASPIWKRYEEYSKCRP